MRPIFWLVLVVLIVGGLYVVTQSSSQYVTLVFIDASTSQALANTKYTIQHIILCEPGADCQPPVVHTSMTNELGETLVKRSYFLQATTASGKLELVADIVVADQTYYAGTIDPDDYTKSQIPVLFESRFR
jgi:hypothetical protein